MYRARVSSLATPIAEPPRSILQVSCGTSCGPSPRAARKAPIMRASRLMRVSARIAVHAGGASATANLPTGAVVEFSPQPPGQRLAFHRRHTGHLGELEELLL